LQTALERARVALRGLQSVRPIRRDHGAHLVVVVELEVHLDATEGCRLELHEQAIDAGGSRFGDVHATLDGDWGRRRPTERRFGSGRFRSPLWLAGARSSIDRLERRLEPIFVSQGLASPGGRGRADDRRERRSIGWANCGPVRCGGRFGRGVGQDGARLCDRDIGGAAGSARSGQPDV
jgi:hypothetical protein